MERKERKLFIDKHGNIQFIAFCDNGEPHYVAELFCDNDEEEQTITEADRQRYANLFAASKDMLNALESIVRLEHEVDMSEFVDRTLAIARAAIAKSRGEE